MGEFEEKEREKKIRGLFNTLVELLLLLLLLLYFHHAVYFYTDLAQPVGGFPEGPGERLQGQMVVVKRDSKSSSTRQSFSTLSLSQFLSLAIAYSCIVCYVYTFLCCYVYVSQYSVFIFLQPKLQQRLNSSYVLFLLLCWSLSCWAELLLRIYIYTALIRQTDTHTFRNG